MGLSYDVFEDSIKKDGEEICGNIVRIFREEDRQTIVMADGSGCGIKANISATFTLKMLATMLSRGEPAREALRAILESIYSGGGPRRDFSTLTMLHLSGDGEAYLAHMGTPRVVFLHRGSVEEMAYTSRTLAGKMVLESCFALKKRDTLVAFSNGVELARNRQTGECLGRDNIAEYLKSSYKPGITAEKITRLLLNVAKTFSGNKPEDDLSVFALRVNKTAE